jgi:hypothetical protein
VPSNAPTLEQIVSWASVLTGENRSGKDYYYVTEEVKRLAWKVTHLKGQLIGLTGLQGTGKTSALSYVGNVLFEQKIESMYIKWTKDWFEKLIGYDALMAFTARFLDHAARDILQSYGHSHKRHPLLGRIPDLHDISEEGFQEIIEKAGFNHALIIGKGEVRKIERQAVWDYFNAECRCILIDLPDYTKADKRLMARDLLEVQNLWERVGAKQNIILAVQKELFSGHFFFGKMDVIELKPIKPEEFLKVFKTQFPNCNLIMDDAILLLGNLSRGVFRRFLKYLTLTLEKFAVSGQEPPIKIDWVYAAISMEQIMADMELELIELFKEPTQRRQAVSLLSQLRGGTMNQKEIAEFLNVSEATAGKIINKLLAYRYVDRQRGEGKAWIISLKV